jgi:hypothetical protein
VQTPLLFSGSNLVCALLRRLPARAAQAEGGRGSTVAALSYVATPLASSVVLSDTQVRAVTGEELPYESQTSSGKWTYVVYGHPVLEFRGSDSVLVFQAPVFQDEPGLAGDVYDGRLHVCLGCALDPFFGNGRRATDGFSMSPTASFPFVVYSHALMGVAKCVPSSIKTEGGPVRIVGSFVPPALGFAAVSNAEVVVLWLTAPSLTSPMTISRGTMDEGGTTITTVAPPFPVRLLLSAQQPQSTVTMLFSFNGGASFSTFTRLAYSFDYFMTPVLLSISRASGAVASRTVPTVLQKACCKSVSPVRSIVWGGPGYWDCRGASVAP